MLESIAGETQCCALNEPAAALTCSRLRQLCQRSRQQLKLTSLGSADTATVRRWTEQLPQRFPAWCYTFVKAPHDVKGL